MCVAVDYAVGTRCRCDMFRRNRITQEHRQRIVQAFENRGAGRSISLFFTVCEQEYVNMPPPPPPQFSIFRRPCLRMKTKTIYSLRIHWELTGQQRARAIVARFIREGRIHELPRGGRNNIRVDEEIRDCLEQIINENCALSRITKVSPTQTRNASKNEH